VGTIAAQQDISRNYIHNLVAGLQAAGLVRAFRGPTGGYELTRDPSEITALDVVAALEGPTSPVACVANGQSCSRSPTCAARDVWRDVGAAMSKVLSDITLADLAERQRAKLEETPMYDI
jgi:Rrf2 family protein